MATKTLRISVIITPKSQALLVKLLASNVFDVKRATMLKKAVELGLEALLGKEPGEKPTIEPTSTEQDLVDAFLDEEGNDPLLDEVFS